MYTHILSLPKMPNMEKLIKLLLGFEIAYKSTIQISANIAKVSKPHRLMKIHSKKCYIVNQTDNQQVPP